MQAKLGTPGSYLSAGDQPLSALCAVMACVFAAAAMVWVSYCRKHGTKVMALHKMMTALVVLRAVLLASQSFKFHRRARSRACVGAVAVAANAPPRVGVTPVGSAQPERHRRRGRVGRDILHPHGVER